jgi:hypothetical protein
LYSRQWKGDDSSTTVSLISLCFKVIANTYIHLVRRQYTLFVLELPYVAVFQSFHFGMRIYKFLVSSPCNVSIAIYELCCLTYLPLGWGATSVTKRGFLPVLYAYAIFGSRAFNAFFSCLPIPNVLHCVYILAKEVFDKLAVGAR